MSKRMLVFGIALVAAGCATHPSTPRSAQRTTLASSAAVSVTAGVSITLSAEQAARVRPYLAADTSPKGHGRNGGLPPGIAKNLERGKALPPGIAKTHLPGSVIATLPALPSGLDYLVVAGKLLLVDAATQVIRDVLLDIAFDG